MSLHFKRLGVLLLSLFGLVSFCSATNVSDLLGSGVNIINKTGVVGNPNTQANWNTMYYLSDFGVSEGTICFRVNVFDTRKTSSVYLYFGFSNASAIPSNRFQYWQNTTGSWVCAYGNKPEMRFALYQATSESYTGYIETEAFLLSDLFNYNITCPTCPSQYTSQECQLEYSLIPISSVDSNYCTTNGLCPSSGDGDCNTGDTNWSALYINNIQHLGKPIITIDIPEELDWDYTSTTGEFNLDIVGYNVDYDFINNIVDTQNYQPTKEDFQQIIESFGPFASLLVGALFIILIFYFIKKAFK